MNWPVPVVQAAVEDAFIDAGLDVDPARIIAAWLSDPQPPQEGPPLSPTVVAAIWSRLQAARH